MDGEIVGYLSSGMYGHSLGSAVGMGYVNARGLNAQRIEASAFEIEVTKKRFNSQA
jgi:glycine cleavage system aminomethyltransferase T